MIGAVIAAARVIPGTAIETAQPVMNSTSTLLPSPRVTASVKPGHRLEPVKVPEWPPLAWLAKCHRSSGVVTVFHGERVEVTPEWFCEAVWAGDYETGDFDQTDIIAGSGGRIRSNEVVFVSSGSTVDRLHSIETPDGAWVSNSLSCLLAARGATVDRVSSQYFWLFRTIVGGLKKYKRFFPTSAGQVRLTYFDNLVWDGSSLTVRPKPAIRHDFSSFARYSGFLQDSMAALAANAGARARRYPYELLSTASSGYDSSTVTVLAKQAGADKVLIFDQARRGIDDSGEPLARLLGMTPVVVPRNTWMSSTLPEVPFIASDSHGGDVFFQGAESLLKGKVLLTGYHGDKLWAKECKSTDENIVRGDQSGLSLTEYRLKIGMIHCPLTFWGVRQIEELHKISNTAEMQPWDVPGDYSRPICRRIVESAGVPREMFGREKKATWVLLSINKHFLSPDSLNDYFGWLEEHRGDFIRRGRIPPTMVRNLDPLDLAFRQAAGTVGGDNHWAYPALKATGAVRVVWRLAETPPYLRRFLFPWALEQNMRSYPKP
jgi:hypothetical protein